MRTSVRMIGWNGCRWDSSEGGSSVAVVFRHWRIRTIMKTAPESAIRVAALQMEPHVGEKERNVKGSLEMIERAAAAGAKLAVLPELCNSGYVFETREEAFALS